ncbi:hypothetical protein AB0C29_15570 [Actinoplanes sp. NPDC048791]|uniref:hypothetical protein n=1 Tax=Actinoplanes sp. NPDC048791 TaxID=3154623 RepID=UPI0033C46695
MVDSDLGTNVHLYEYGEAYDDLRPAFFIDERVYDDPQLAQSVVESADAAMTRAGVIYEVEVTSGRHATRPIGVPTWEEFKQRHFVDGVPLPVRPARHDPAVPPSWAAMIRAVEDAHRAFREELVQLVTTALPGQGVFTAHDPGPLRRSAGSVNWSEESFGFEVTIQAGLGDLPPAEALDRVSTLLAAHGWRLEERITRPAGVAVEGFRDHFAVLVDARPAKITVLGESPLYRAPAAPASAFVIEPR